MIVTRKAAVKGSLGENPKAAKHGFASRMGTAYHLRKCLEDTKEYLFEKEEAEKNGDHFRCDPGKENMAMVLRKEIPLHIHAHRSDDICTAIRIAKEYDIRIVIVHCTDGIDIAEHIAASGFPAIVGPSMFQREELQRLRGVAVGGAQPREGGPQGQQAPVVVHQGVVLPGAGPVQTVQGGGGVVAVAHALFGAGKLFARLQEGQAETGEVDAGGQPVLGQCHRVRCGELRPLVAHAEQFVPQGEVVVGGHIAYDLAGGVGWQTVAAAPGGHRAADVPEAAGLALRIARLPGIETAALDGVAGVVAEDADALVQHGQVRLVGLVPVQLAAAALPRLTVHQDASAARKSVQRGPQFVHGVHVIEAHEVEAEAVDVIFLRPVEHRVV